MNVPRKGKRESRVLAILWGIPALLILLEAHRLAGQPKLRDKGFWEGPAGYMTALGVLLIGFAIWEAVEGMRPRRPEVFSPEKPGSSISRRIWLMMVWMVLFLALVPFLGFILASGIFLAGAMRLLGCTIPSILITACTYCGALYWLVPVLGLSLPRGFWGF
jgi:hypothetical protein